MIDHNHFICHFIFGGHLLNIPMNGFLLHEPFFRINTSVNQLTVHFCSSIDLAIPISRPLNSASPLRRPRQE